jgi:hypothetical protein
MHYETTDMSSECIGSLAPFYLSQKVGDGITI